MKRISILFIAALLVSITSCSKMYEMNQPKEVSTEYSVVWPLAGEWFVTYQFDNGTGVVDDWYGVGHTTLLTYNTADEDANKIWISDEANFWEYKVKSDCNVEENSISSADSLVNNIDGYDIKINIKNGKVIADGGKSLSGVVTDSIYFEIEFADDPGTIYQVSGIRRTGFLEDELDEY